MSYTCRTSIHRRFSQKTVTSYRTPLVASEVLSLTSHWTIEGEQGELIREQVPTENLFHAISKFRIRVVPRVSCCYWNFFVNSKWRVTHSEHWYQTMRRLDFRRLPVPSGLICLVTELRKSCQLRRLVKWSLTRDWKQWKTVNRQGKEVIVFRGF